MNKTLGEIFKYNVFNASDQLLLFVKMAREDKNCSVEDLASNIEWVANEMQKQYFDNVDKFKDVERGLSFTNNLLHSVMNNYIKTVDNEDLLEINEELLKLNDR